MVQPAQAPMAMYCLGTLAFLQVFGKAVGIAMQNVGLLAEPVGYIECVADRRRTQGQRNLTHVERPKRAALAPRAFATRGEVRRDLRCVVTTIQCYDVLQIR